MIKNLHFSLIFDPKHDISKRCLKRCILTWFLRFFWPEITSKIFESNIFRLNSIRAIDWCMNCHMSKRKNFYTIFTIRGDPYHKKSQNFFLIEIWQFIHQSKARVEFSWNMLLLNFFEVISGQKNLKNHDKIRLFKWRFEISCFGT